VKIGSENRTQVIAASALGLIALVRVGFMVWPSGPSVAPAAASPSVSTSTSASSTSTGASRASGRSPESKANAKLVASADMSLDPTLRLQLLHAVEGINYGGSGRNIFIDMPDPPPVPVAVVSPVVDVPTGPPPPPPPPAINLKFFGFANKAGEPKRIFLSENEDVFIAAEGDIVNRRYKVIHINPSSAEIQDVLYNHSQNIPLTQN
jgi:hypothetical protein